MGSGSTPRFSIEYPVATDATNVPGDMQTAMDDIDALLITVYEGPLSTIPTAADTPAPSFYFVTSGDAPNYGKLFLNTGTVWVPCGAVNSSASGAAGIGGSTLLAPNTPGNPAEQGGSGLSADAEHQHPMAPWGGSVNIQPPARYPYGGSSGRFADAAHVHSGMQVGDVTWSLASAPGPDQLLANGQAVPYAEYPTLYGIATSQGWPQNSPPVGYFNVIDLRGVSPIGAGGAYAAGASYGASTATLSVNNLAAHAHSAADGGHGHAAPSHLQFAVGSVGHSTLFINSGADIDHLNNTNVTYNLATETGYASITIGSTGSGTPFSILHPCVAMNPFLKAL